MERTAGDRLSITLPHEKIKKRRRYKRETRLFDLLDSSSELKLQR
jgi:hypothetical protein